MTKTKTLTIFFLLPLLFITGCAFNTSKQTLKDSPVASSTVEQVSTNTAQILIDKECTNGDSNVYLTECAVELLDKKSAEREWKQRKIESLKHPQINEYDLFGDLKKWQNTIAVWRKDYEKTRDTWCEAEYSFKNGSGIPYDVAVCKLGFEVRAIDTLNNLYYVNIMQNVSDSEGVKDFEPSQADIEKLTKTNITKRGCIWAGEKEPNCVSPIYNKLQDQEVTFKNPINIKWIGRVATFMVSGQAYALEKIPSDEKNPYFYAEPFETIIDGDGLIQLKYPVNSVVEITGKQVGIICAYPGSVFGGRCVPDVIVESVSLVK